MNMPHSDEQLEELDRLLLALPTEHDGLDLYELDGFVAGLLVCPEAIMPSEWLPVVWGEGDEPSFENLDQAQATINAVMGHYNRVAEGLARNPPDYEAILGVDPNSDDLLWEPWISGFECAMRLRPDVWEATLESDDEEVRATIPMILAMHEIDVGTTKLDEEAVDELDELAPELIPGIVITLNSWARGEAAEHRGSARGAAAFAPRPKVGRNEPCPCGSGKKFKKCCASVVLH
jgi:uncharacterized protein